MQKHQQLKSSLFKLAQADGMPGAETTAAEVAKGELEKFMQVEKDVLGNVVGKIGGKGPHILLDAHLDQIGLIVTAIDEKGFIRFDRCGGADVRVLPAHEVLVWGEKTLYGLVCSMPPHLTKAESAGKAKPADELAIDVGMDKKSLSKIVKPGDRISLKGPQGELLGGRVFSPTLDDRAGVASVLRCLEILKDKEHGCRLTVLFSTQEETSGSGAKVASYKAEADEAIAVDVSFACAPGLLKEKCADLGGGTMVGVAPTLDRGMSKDLINLAQRENIPYQVEVMGGRTGTNAHSIQNSGKGLKMALLSLPLRNMHTAVEVADLEDIESTARLMAAYILERGQENA